MFRATARLSLGVLFFAFLFACSAGENIEVEVQVLLDGQPAAGARVLLDGMEDGRTGQDGRFVQTIVRKVGSQTRITVNLDRNGYRIEPWEESFTVTAPEKGAIGRYAFQAELKSTKYFTLSVTSDGAPVAEAEIRQQKKLIGRTDPNGEFSFEYETMPAKGLKIAVTREGLSSWEKSIRPEPGEKVGVVLYKEIPLTVKAFTQEYGLTRELSGAVVRINGKAAGKTDKRGRFTYRYAAEPGGKVKLSVSAPGYLPNPWKTEVAVTGEKTIERCFHPVAGKPIRVAIYGYVGNTPDEDLSRALKEQEEALAAHLFDYRSFEKVPAAQLHQAMKKTKLDLETLTSKGWQDTPLLKTADMIVLGSMARDEKGFVIETKVYTSGGKMILSEIAAAAKERHIDRTAKATARNIARQFPFEGTLAAFEDGRFRINLGSKDYQVKRGTEFAVLKATYDRNGKMTGYREIGTLKVKRARRDEAWGEVVEKRSKDRVRIGQKVVRRLPGELEMLAAENSFIVAVKGGIGDDVAPLGGVNVYLDDLWIDTTGGKGTAVVPVRLGKTYDLVLYRHGYQKESTKVSVGRDGERKEFILTVNNSLLKIDSTPSGAEVFVDGGKAGTTPILHGKSVGFGFHKLRLVAGGDYRAWEEIVEFNKKVEDRTGKDRIVFFKDYLKIGSRAEAGGNFEQAIRAYASAGKEHPDFVEARHRLGRLYMDEKSDYQSAIAEFEKVVATPEVKDLVFKQYCVVYTNLGHAAYARGNELIPTDRQEAARYLSQAIRSLEVAKQNTRFFPQEHYDEAVHDTYYYTALAYHKLYLVTKKNALLAKADQAWREYMDFFPRQLDRDPAFRKMHEAGEKYWQQIRELL